MVQKPVADPKDRRAASISPRPAAWAITTVDAMPNPSFVEKAKPEAVAFYEKLGFMPLELVEGQSDARPAPTPMFLSVREIQGAARS